MDQFGDNQFKALEERLEEIRLHLLDNDPNNLGDLIPLTSADGKFVQVRRRVGTKREYIAVYERITQPRLRVMTDNERVLFRKLLHHPMTHTIPTYEGEKLTQVKSERNPSSLGYALRMLKGNGYSVVRAIVYHMTHPFDLRPPVVVTKRDRGNGYREYFYVLDNVPAYVEVGASKR